MDNSLLSITLRRLQVFLEVCDTLHMARAAERLRVAQPALSQQIRALETALGVRLFNRRKRGIDLTAAGEACKLEAQKLLARHKEMLDTVRRTGRGEMGRLSVGYVSSAMLTRQFPAQLKAMSRQFPGIALGLEEGNIATLVGNVSRGDIDVALVRGPSVVNAPLTQRFHSRQNLVVALPRTHPLAALKRIPVARLASESMIGFSDTNDVGIMRVVAEFATAAKVTLQIKWQVSDMGTVLALVAAGLGYGIVPDDISTLAGPELVTRPLAEKNASAELFLVWHADRITPAINRFLSICGRSTANTA